MNEQDYNGWKNRATWNISLWLNNDEDYYKELLAMIKENKSDNELAEAIKNFVSVCWENKGKFGDLTDKKELDTVDWLSIAKANRE